MKVRIPIVIDVDPQKWADINGQVADSDGKPISAAAVREDVRSFVLNLVQQAAMVEDTDAEVTA